MIGKKKKEEVIEDKRKGFPVYCKNDGKLLLDGEGEISFYFGEKTGRKMKRFRYSRYCADWNIERSRHTEYYGLIVNEYVDDTV